MQPEFLQSQYRHLSNPRLRGVLLHGIFWIVWLARNVYDGLNIWGWTWASLYTLTIFLSQAPLVYLHLYWLVPSYLNKKKILGYVTLTTVLVLLSSWCNYHLLQFIPKTDMPVLMSNFLERITWNYNVLEGIIILILTYALKYTLIAFLTQNELLRLQKEKLQLELRSLKSQVHPHFLFNTLNNLYSLTLKNSERAGEMVLKLSDIMRYVLYEANEDQVPLEKEIAFIKNYIELQRIRYNEKYTIEFKVEGQTEGKLLAPLLFIDFVENAFKHGLDKRFSDGYVKVNFNIQEHHLDFTVTNSAGQSDDKKNASTGIGLQNVKRRLELIYAEQHHLTIVSDEEQFKVHLKMQLR